MGPTTQVRITLRHPSSPVWTGVRALQSNMQACQSTTLALRAARTSRLKSIQRRNLQDIAITRTGKPIIRVSGGRSSLGGHTATVFIEYDLRNTASIDESVRHSDMVFNLVGRDYPTKNFDLEDVHIEGPSHISEAVAKYDIDRFIHV